MHGGDLNGQWQTEIAYSTMAPFFIKKKLESETDVTLTNNREC